MQRPTDSRCRKAIAALAAAITSAVAAVPLNPSLAQDPSPDLDVGAVVQELQACTRMRLQERGTATTLEELQAVSLDCLYRTLVLSPDGRVRDDASERLAALVAATSTRNASITAFPSASLPRALA